MKQATIHADSSAALSRLKAKHPELKKELKEKYGFAVFPSVGRAGVVLGGAYGKGEVYERGKSVGFSTVSQMTVGVQVGGQTFTELILFNDKKALDGFKDGKVAFTANASAVIVKAAASGTTNYDAVTAHAYSQGGMLLELSLGGQKFTFIPPKTEEEEQREEERAAEPWWKRHAPFRAEGEGEESQEGERQGGLALRGARGLLKTGGRVMGTARSHPIMSTALGLGLAGAGLAVKALRGQGEAEAPSQPEASN